MSFLSNNIYHLYNRSINKEILFKDGDDYLRFLTMTRKHFSTSCNILGWCLMPNHFHFLIHVDENSILKKKVGGLELQALQIAIRNLLSSYSKYYNFRYDRKGNLFQQKTKSKMVESDAFQLLCYIHQNPWKAGMVNKMKNWIYSSFQDFADLRRGTLCNINLATELLDIHKQSFYQQSYSAVSNETILKLGLDDCSPKG
jgi:putative transposase